MSDSVENEPRSRSGVCIQSSKTIIIAVTSIPSYWNVYRISWSRSTFTHYGVDFRSYKIVKLKPKLVTSFDSNWNLLPKKSWALKYQTFFNLFLLSILFSFGRSHLFLLVHPNFFFFDSHALTSKQQNVNRDRLKPKSNRNLARFKINV